MKHEVERVVRVKGMDEEAPLRYAEPAARTQNLLYSVRLVEITKCIVGKR